MPLGRLRRELFGALPRGLELRRQRVAVGRRGARVLELALYLRGVRLAHQPLGELRPQALEVALRFGIFGVELLAARRLAAQPVRLGARVGELALELGELAAQRLERGDEPRRRPGDGGGFGAGGGSGGGDADTS